jgi:hypothetical protein
MTRPMDPVVDLSGFVFLPEVDDDPRILRKAAQRCREAMRSADALVSEGVRGTSTTEADGRIRIHGEDRDAIDWKDDRPTGGMMSAEHWRPIPQGEDGAGDMLRSLMLRWPSRAPQQFFLPRTIADVSAIFAAGAEVCDAAAAKAYRREWHHDPFATVLRHTMRRDLVYTVPSPWSGAALEVFIDVDEAPAGYDESVLALVTSRIRPAITPKLLGMGDQAKIVVVPHRIAMYEIDEPDSMSVLRAMAEIEAMPVLREAGVRIGGRRITRAA